MEYNPNAKGTMIPVEYNPIVSSPNGKSTILWKIVFRIGNSHGKSKENTA